MKVEIKGWICRLQASYMKEPLFNFTAYKGDDDEKILHLFKHTIIVEVPDGEMIPERIAGIRAAKNRVNLGAAEKLATLDEIEQKLLCLPNEVKS